MAGPWIDNLFDNYSRVARLYPALLTLAPVIWSAIILYPSLISSLPHTTAFLVAVAALLYFLASIARSRGKLVEPGLLEKWGGWPTTIILRHGDRTIDRVTKGRYHRALSNLCDGLEFPSQSEETTQASGEADETYRSATKKLIEQRRDSRYSLVHAENASYGFRRNLLGLKPAAVALTAFVGILTFIAWWLVVPHPLDAASFEASVIAYPHLPILVALDLAYLGLWLWAIREGFVRQAAFEYAIALLRTLDQGTA